MTEGMGVVAAVKAWSEPWWYTVCFMVGVLMGAAGIILLVELAKAAV